MIYGLYLSATGVTTNSYKQDVIANNLANLETAGFRRDLTRFRERRTAADEDISKRDWTDPRLEAVGGGTFVEPNTIDTSAGGFEETGNTLDAAIDGNGYFQVDDHGTTRLTRNGHFQVDADGNLLSGAGNGARILDTNGRPIVLNPSLGPVSSVAEDGTINQGGVAVARLSVVDVPNPSKLTKRGGVLLDSPEINQAAPTGARVKGGYIERSNVDSATELTALMETQRQLEANANMIRYQDQTLDKLVNSVGKVSS